ncbi:MAG: HlyD family secretion protein [Bacteroidetes bacterium]|nr:HlyD family secretion protein [Bacteroidota bacterium]
MESQTQTQEKAAFTNNGPQAEPPKRKINKRFIIVLALLAVAGGSFGITKYVHAQHHEETDDAQTEANMSPIIPRLGGYVAEVRVVDNQRVRQGDTLIVLDNRDQLIKLEQAEAALAGARSNLAVARANSSTSDAHIATAQAQVGTANAQIEAAKVAVWRTQQDYKRYSNLIKDHSITQQQFEQAEAAKLTAERQLAVLEEQRAAATKQSAAAGSQAAATNSGISVAEAMVRQRETEVDNARLILSYAVLTAPSDGFVSKVNVQSGQFVQPGQTLFAVVMKNALWVVANFKETQLRKMKVGQEVIVHADAFPNHDFKASIASFSPATGSSFSLLPPDNASGNFVKVVQRIPVRIEFTDKNDSMLPRLRAGMNVDVDVHI